MGPVNGLLVGKCLFKMTAPVVLAGCANRARAEQQGACGNILLAGLDRRMAVCALTGNSRWS
jgi:hypothetical protein